MSSVFMPEFRLPCVGAAGVVQTGACRLGCATGDIHLACTFPLEEAGEVALMGTDRFSSRLSFLALGTTPRFGTEPSP